jgi:predicted CXXCH cytochrome family protein
VWVWLLIACGGEPSSEPVVAPSADPGPIATFPADLDPAVLDSRPAISLHEKPGPCSDCHLAQTLAWRDSPHDLALGAADQALGVFEGQTIVLDGMTVTPTQDGKERFLTITDGAGTRQYRVRHTFGYDPLQQLLLEGDNGALWVSPIAWDVTGGRWYDPAPDGVAADPADPLYWAGLFGTWNHMCATCHSTEVVEAFDPATRSYGTTWQHEDVACEACHGKGPEIQTLARGSDQVETCAACHSLRGPLAPGWQPGAALLDHFTPALLDNSVYRADGSIQADREAFVWGSFQQSAMAQAGVRCTHCHAPHGTGLVVQGNALCTRCHAERFDAETHDGGQACVDCHMPQARYMGLDLRRDHAFAVPGRDHPDLPAALVARARLGDPDSLSGLLAAVGSTATPFHRASALALLRRQRPPPNVSVVVAALSDPSDLVRWQATELMSAWGHGTALWPLLADPVRTVRYAAAKALIGQGETSPEPADAKRFTEVLAELERSLAAEADEPANHLNLAVIQAVSGDLTSAIASARTAVRIAPAFTPGWDMLAALLDQAGRHDEARSVRANHAP